MTLETILGESRLTTAHVFPTPMETMTTFLIVRNVANLKKRIRDQTVAYYASDDSIMWWLLLIEGFEKSSL